MLSQKGNGVILGVLIGLVLAGGLFGIYYIWFLKSDSKPEQVSKSSAVTNSSTQVQSSPPSLPVSSQTSYIDLSTAWSKGLKTYTNPYLSISFQYPNSFEAAVFTPDQTKGNGYYESKIKDYEYPSLSLSVESPVLSDEEFRKASESDPNFYLTYSNNKMMITVRQFNNTQHLSLYDFIAKEYSVYGGNGAEATFDDFKKNLKSTSIPFPNSYENLNSVSESPNRKIFFEAAGKIYEFSLTGGDGTGQGYSDDANNIFNSVLKSVKAK